MKKGATKNYFGSAEFLATIFMAVCFFVFLGIALSFITGLLAKNYTVTYYRTINVTIDLPSNGTMFGPMKDKVSDADYLNPDSEYWNGYISPLAGSFHLKNAPLPLFVFIHFWDAFTFAFLFWIFYLVRKFVVSLKMELMFTQDNIKLLKILGLAVFFAPIVDMFVLAFILPRLLNRVSFYGRHWIVSYQQDYYLYFGIILLGYFILSITSVFEKGLKLKEENDLTV